MAGWSLTLHAHCGTAMPLKWDLSCKEDARAEAARAIWAARRDGYPVVTLERGREWEIEEPDSCIMVPDDCGVLVLRGPGEKVPL